MEIDPQSRVLTKEDEDFRFVVKVEYTRPADTCEPCMVAKCVVIDENNLTNKKIGSYTRIPKSTSTPSIKKACRIVLHEAREDLEDKLEKERNAEEALKDLSL